MVLALLLLAHADLVLIFGILPRPGWTNECPSPPAPHPRYPHSPASPHTPPLHTKCIETDWTARACHDILIIPRYNIYPHFSSFFVSSPSSFHPSIPNLAQSSPRVLRSRCLSHPPKSHSSLAALVSAEMPLLNISSGSPKKNGERRSSLLVYIRKVSC